MALKSIEEEEYKPKWADRPHVGDLVQSKVPNGVKLGKVIHTFYCNGDGGLHVVYDGESLACWGHYTYFEILEKAIPGFISKESQP
jgi:hypothetical protein